MYSVAAVRLARCGFRYTKYIGDGDGKGHANVVASATYGPGVDVVKLECVGHCLRESVKKHSGSKLSDGRSISGCGCLTGDLINSLQIWFGLALRKNIGDHRAMARAIWASLCHSA